MLGVETNPLSGLLGATDQTASIGTNLYTVDYKNDYYLTTTSTPVSTRRKRFITS